MRVRNTGTEDATNVLVNDTVPPGTTYVEGSASGGQSVSLSGRTLTWTIASLPVGGLEFLSFSVVVDDPLPTDANGVPVDVRNQAVVTGSTETGVLPRPVPSTEVRNPTIGLTIVKSAAPPNNAPVSYGGPIEYIVRYTNVGSLTLTDADIVDDVPLGTTFVSAANGGVFTPGGAFGRGRVTWIVPSLAAGASSTVTYNVLVDNPTNPANMSIFNAAAVQPTQVPLPVDSNRTQHVAAPLPTPTPTHSDPAAKRTPCGRPHGNARPAHSDADHDNARRAHADAAHANAWRDHADAHARSVRDPNADASRPHPNAGRGRDATANALADRRPDARTD